MQVQKNINKIRKEWQKCSGRYLRRTLFTIRIKTKQKGKALTKHTQTKTAQFDEICVILTHWISDQGTARTSLDSLVIQHKQLQNPNVSKASLFMTNQKYNSKTFQPDSNLLPNSYTRHVQYVQGRGKEGWGGCCSTPFWITNGTAVEFLQA